MSPYAFEMALFAINVTLVGAVVVYVARRWVAPALAPLTFAASCAPLLAVSGLRASGAAVLLPGVASPEIPEAFATALAYGDLASATLAVLALWSGCRRGLVWLYTVVGLGDLAVVGVQIFATGVTPSELGAAYFLVVLMVPILATCHALIVWRLLRAEG